MVPGYLIINGDSRRLPIDLGSVDAVVTDPPYGIGYQHGGYRHGCAERSFGGKGKGMLYTNLQKVIGDDQLFDPSPWLGLPCLFFGPQHCDPPPRGGSWLVWDKVDGHEFGDTFGDCDFAWYSVPGIKRNIFRYLWKGSACVKIDEHAGRGGVIRHHPSQKPIALMRWCIRLMKLPPGSLILDPYMGSGTTLIAALAEGHRAIGIEIDPRYCQIAQHRLERPHARPHRPARVEPALPLFGDIDP